MRLFPRRRTPDSRDAAERSRADEDHLAAFVRSHRGVEAYVEPPTALTSCTAVFVASTGEWTRRRFWDATAAHRLANRLGVPSYDAAVVGYPQRMREWSAAQAAAQRERER